MRRLSKILLIIPVLYLFLMPVYILNLSNARLCSGMTICIADSLDYHFVTKRQLLNIITMNNGKILGQPLGSVSVFDIENRINMLRELKVAEVYMSIDGTLHVYVDQRNPVMRVIPDEGGDYFIDEEGIVMRRRNLYTPRLQVIGGNISITPAMLSGVSILDTVIKNSILKDIYQLVVFTSNKSFWSAQIDQIYVDGNNEIDLIPRVGNQLIHLGTIENYEGKLRNLAAFYEKVLPEVGWNRYSVINLEYKDQIVCSKR